MSSWWIFRAAGACLGGRAPRDPGIAEKLAVMRAHLDLAVETWGEPRGCLVFRKFFYWYTRGLREVRALRARANQACSVEELSALLREVQQHNPPVLG